jgi:hypothetical protein
MVTWTIVLVALVLVLGGLFSVLVIFSLSRSGTGGDLDWQIARLERKVDLILTHLGIGHDEHIPGSVTALAEAGKTLEAIHEYRRITGVRQSVARREIEFLVGRFAEAKDEKSSNV